MADGFDIDSAIINEKTQLPDYLQQPAPGKPDVP
jgi:hypothetical protein